MSSAFPQTDYTDTSLSAQAGAPTNAIQGEPKNQPPFTNAVGSSNPTPIDPLLKQAQQEAAAAIAAQVNPLQAQIGSLTRNQGAASAAIGQEFGNILPSVADSATRLEQANATAAQQAQGVYQQASSELNTLQQNSAAQAQRLAQQVGGPVSTGQFTSASDPYAQAEVASGAVDQLHSLDLGAAANRSAEVFAGQVFPALAMEQQQKNRQYYQDQIKTIQDEITKIQAGKGTLISDNLAKLQTQEKQFQLDLANLKLKKLQDNRNWDATKRRLDQTDTSLSLAGEKNTIAINALKQAGYYKDVAAAQSQQRINQADVRITNQEKQAWARIGLQGDRLKAQVAHYAETGKLAQARLDVQQQKNAAALVDAAMTPGGSKPVTLTTKIPLNPSDPAITAALLGRGSADVHSDGKGHWYEYKKMTLTPAQWAHGVGTPNTGGIHDPNQLYQLLIDNNTPTGMAKSIVSSRLGLTDWTPGQKASYTPAELAKLSVPKLDKLAKQRGYSSTAPTLTKQRAIDFITATNP